MFRDHQLKWQRLVLLGAGIVTVIWFAVLWFEGADFHILWKSLARFGFVSSILYCSWLALIKWAWHWPIFKRWLIAIPDLRGRWVGAYKSSMQDYTTEMPMALEIRQSMLHIDCVTYSPFARGDGYSARLLSDREDNEFKLALLYHAKRAPSVSVPGDEHQGVMILHLIETSPRRLRGFYLNDRDGGPAQGEVTLEWESYELKRELGVEFDYKAFKNDNSVMHH